MLQIIFMTFINSLMFQKVVGNESSRLKLQSLELSFPKSFIFITEKIYIFTPFSFYCSTLMREMFMTRKEEKIVHKIN